MDTITVPLAAPQVFCPFGAKIRPQAQAVNQRFCHLSADNGVDAAGHGLLAASRPPTAAEIGVRKNINSVRRHHAPVAR